MEDAWETRSAQFLAAASGHISFGLGWWASTVVFLPCDTVFLGTAPFHSRWPPLGIHVFLHDLADVIPCCFLALFEMRKIGIKSKKIFTLSEENKQG